MGDLKDGPDHFLLFLSFMRSVLGILEFVGEFEQRVFDVFKSIWWGLAVSGATDRRHIGFEKRGERRRRGRIGDRDDSE